MGVEWLKDDEAIITVRWRRWFGLAEPELARYRGSGTIWHDAETGRRCPTHIELKLADIWTKALWEKTE